MRSPASSSRGKPGQRGPAALGAGPGEERMGGGARRRADPRDRARAPSPIAAAVDTRVPRRAGRLVLRGRGGAAVPLHDPKPWLTEQLDNPLATIVATLPSGGTEVETAGQFPGRRAGAGWAGPRAA